ncbi:MAG: efflux RND transporter permease subunit [Hyphomonadaceae bacterium]|nr:efflux RND transporter permease subunit [Hyphomonadaceae bacterium]
MLLSAIVRASLARPRVVLLAALLLAIYGGLTLTRAKYDVFPEFVPAQASVQTEAPGLTAEQVELLVTRPLEEVINGANGVASVRSESIQGLSVINVTFEEGAEPFRARQIVSEQLAQAAGLLPAGIASPTLTPLTSSTMDLLKIGFTSDRLTQLQMRDFIEWTVRPRLLAVPGVARANIFGGAPRRLEVRVRREDLLARSLSIADVANSVRAATQVRGGGFIDTPAQRILVEPRGQAVTAAALGQAVVAPGAGLPVRLMDVADVVDAPAPQFGDTLVMGKPGALLTLSSQYGANTLDVTHSVEAALADLKPAIEAQGIRIYPALHRPANFIETALGHIELDLLIGAALIALVLIFFLRSPRVALVAFVSIPLSLLAAVIVLDALGQTINTMSLGGLAVALGVVIDDAVVGVENIVRRLRLAHTDARTEETILDASIEVRAPIVYATIVLAATVAPILFLSGLQGAFFSPLAFSFLLATLASLLVALTVTPALALLALRDEPLHEEPSWVVRFKDAHARWLRGFCGKPRIAIAAAALAAVVTCGSFFVFGAELLPAFRERHYVLQMTGPPGASFAWMRQIGAEVTHDLLAIPGVATVEQQIGRAAAGEDTWPPNRSEFHVELAHISGRQEDQVLHRIRAVLESYPGMSTEALTFLGDRIGESLSGETAAIAIGIYGPDLDVLDRVAEQIAATLSRVRGAADVQVKAPPATPLLQVALDQTRLGLRGLSVSDAYDAVEAAYQGQVVAQIADGQRIADVAIVAPSAGPAAPEAAGGLIVQGASGGGALDDVASLRSSEGRASILHDGARRRQVVTANPTTSDVAGFTARARAAIAREIRLPPGVYLEYTGVAKGQAAAARQVLLNVAVAAIGIVALLVLAFGDGRAAMLILAGAPFALAGGALAVVFIGGVLSLGALVGFVTLFGIAARNAILLVSHADHLVNHEGATWGLETVLRATRERVTPILMTALVTALGLLPLAFGTGEAGREVQGPMAVVILGGLVTSTIMTLLVLPALVLAFRRRSPAPPPLADAIEAT